MFQLKKGDDLEIYETDFTNNKELNDSANLKQPFLFSFSNFDNTLKEISLMQLILDYGSFDVFVKDNRDYYADKPSNSIVLTLNATDNLMKTDPDAKYYSDGNQHFIEETGVQKYYNQFDKYLKPTFNVFSKYDVIFGIRIGSNRSLTSIRDSSFTSRTLSSTTATTTNNTLSKNSSTADSFLLEMLLTHSHWKKGQVQGISLKKSFELRDVRTSERFENMVRDFLLKLEKNKSKQVVSLQIDKLVGSAIVNVTVISIQEKKEEEGQRNSLSREDSTATTTYEIVSQESIEAAMAVDSIAAELQLGGNPNWS